MDEKQLHALKEAKKKISEGSLVIWNTRLDALAAAGSTEDLINFAGTAPEWHGWVDICGCGGGSPKCACPCSPTGTITEDPSWGTQINEMNKQIYELGKEIKALRQKLS